jgi:ADP-heptose:LPS heptosyltransferase
MATGWLFRLGGLGDLMVALPALRLVRRVVPTIRLLLVGREPYARLLKDAAVVDGTASADEARWAPLLAGSPVASPNLLADPPDYILGWFHGRTAPPLEERARNFAPAAIAGAFRADPAFGSPLSEIFFAETERFFRSRGVATPPYAECARLPVSGFSPARRFAVIHPGSGGRDKCWPLDRFLEVAAFLGREGFSGIFVTGEAESRLEPVLRRTLLPAGWTWRPNLPLSGLAGILAVAALFVGNDSGVTHLAAAVGAPVVALFREDNVSAWRPFGDVRVLSAPDVGLIRTAEVVQALSIPFLTNGK